MLLFSNQLPLYQSLHQYSQVSCLKDHFSILYFISYVILIYLRPSRFKIFFENKKWFAGGKIPQCELLSDNSVDVVLKTPFNESSFSFFHDCCLSKISCPKDFVDEGVPWEVCYLISLFREMKIYGLPKDFQPGFLMLFFKFCKGINIPQPPIF